MTLCRCPHFTERKLRLGVDEQCQKRPHRVEEEPGLKPQESDPRTLTNMSGCLLPVRRSLEEEVGEVLGRTSGKSSRVRLS